MSFDERFWSKVDKPGDEPGACWAWKAYVARNGYGQFRLGGRARYAHRLAWEMEHGAIPDGMDIDHICHNRACVRPAHLRPADRSSNLQNRSGSNANSSSGVRGVYWDGRRKTWYARAKLNGKNHNLGSYPSITRAEEAVVAWRRENMPYSINDQRKEAG